jgi:MoxR-like ATPase
MSDTPASSDSSDPRPDSGSLDFVCQSCGRQLRVPANLAGRKAKCPECGAIQTVDAPSRSSPERAAAPSVAPAAGGDDLLQVPAPTPLLQTQEAEPPPPPTSLSASLESSGGEHQGRDTETKRLFDRITGEISKIFVGQQELVLGSLVALFSSGHVLIESVPGLGKTLFVRTLGRVLGCQFSRIQFTADLMPSDITGAPIFDMKMQDFRFRPGPVFTQFLLADEINRSPAKTHAALLEIMQEYRVTIDGKSHPLTKPFLVLATQNPIESEGTYNLPEAQLDRFMFKLVADYPRAAEEAKILDMHSRQIDLNERLERDVAPVTTPEEIVRVTRENSDIRVDPKLIEYINKIVRLTRKWPQLHMGASPRAGIALMQSARTLAAFAGRDYAVPDDVVQLVLAVLRHRVILTAEAEVEGRNVDELLGELIRSVDVPRI